MQFELTKEFIDDVIQAIDEKNNSLLIERIHSLHPADIAEVLDIVDLPQAQYL